MRRVMVRYKVKPDRVAENEELVRAVYDELQRTEPAGLQLRDVPLDDGVSFVHLASIETEDGRNPLAGRGGVRALPGEHRRSLRRSAGRRRAARDRLVPMRHEAAPRSPRRPPGAAHRRPAGRERVLLASSCAGDRSGSTPAAAPTSRSSWAGPSAAASSSAARGAPCGSPTSRSTRRRGHRPGRAARGVGAARAARGPGGLAQRRRDARGRGDRLLAAEARRSGWGA